MTTEVIEDTGTQDADTQSSEKTPPHSEEISAPESALTESKPDEPAEKKPETPKWVQKRIDQLTAKAKQAEQRAIEAEMRASAKESGQESSLDVDAIAERKATAMVRQKTFDDACNEVHKVGVSEFKEKFAPAVVSLQQVIGSDFTQFLEAVVDQGSTKTSAEMLVYFAENPDEASAFVDLNPRAQGRELERISAKLASKKTASASKVPSPVSTVSGTGRASSASAGTDDETEWYARREAEVRKNRR